MLASVTTSNERSIRGTLRTTLADRIRNGSETHIRDAATYLKLVAAHFEDLDRD